MPDHEHVLRLGPVTVRVRMDDRTARAVRTAMLAVALGACVAAASALA